METMVMGIIVAMTAEVVVIVAESVAAVVVAETAGLVVAAVVIGGPVVVAVDADESDDFGTQIWQKSFEISIRK
jgi:hypothetical protein